MAKQATIGSGVVAAAREVSAIQGRFQDYGGQFMSGYGKTLEKKKQLEQEAKATQERVNTLMSGFKNDIDVLKFKPEDQTLVKNTIVRWRNEYAEAANAAAKIQDKSSAEYQEYMDVLNDIQNRMVNLKNNLDNFAAFKAEYAENIKAKTYSNAGANALSLAQGETMVTNPIGSISDSGDLQWGPGTGSVREGFSFQDYDMPFAKATDTANALGAIADPYRRQKTPLDSLQKTRIREQVTNLVSDPKALAGLISDSDLPEFDFSNIDPEDPNAKEQVVDLLVNSIYRLRGSGLTPAERAAINSTDGNDGNGKNFYKLPNGAIVAGDMKGVYDDLVKTTELLLAPASNTDVPKAPPAYNIGTASSPYIIAWDMNSKTWYHEDTKNGVIDEFESPMDIVVRNQSLFK